MTAHDALVIVVIPATVLLAAYVAMRLNERAVRRGNTPPAE